MKWRIVIVLGCLAVLSLQALPAKARLQPTAAPVPALLTADIDAAPAPAVTAISSVEPVVTPTVAPAAAVPAEVVDVAALMEARKNLKEKDALIERLSRHLESALARLNQTASPVVSQNTSVAALNAVKAKLEQQNNILKTKQEELQAKIDEISKKSQLLDLENRQLFEALNGCPYQERELIKPAKNERRGDKRQFAGE